ncbi:MAG: hypothetical protein AAFY28_21510 [Actinomycetota bacterium]
MPISRAITTIAAVATVAALAAGCADTASSQTAAETAATTVTNAPTTSVAPDATPSTREPAAAAVATQPSTTPAPSATSAATMPTTTAPPTTTPSTTAAPAPVSLVAVTAQGDAVHVDGGAVSLMVDADPQDAPLPAEGPGALYVSGISRSADGSRAWVGLCCEPYAGSVIEPSAPGQQSLFGRAPAVDPSGRYLATGQIGGIAVGINDLMTGEVPAAPAVADPSFVPDDVMWLDGTTVATLGTTDSATMVHLSSVGPDGVALVASTEIPLAGDARFAGVDVGNVMIHEVGTDRVVALSPDGATTSEYTLGAPARSYWFADGDDVIVDPNGTLTVGAVTVPGEYVWAR